MTKFLLLILLPPATLNAATIAMDSQRGDKVFVSQGCVQCHRLKGTGGTTAPDLGRVLDRAYTPDELASAMWNHAPTMWGAIQRKDVKVGDLDPQAAADLFASFYSARYFELPGDAARGKRLFTAKGCAGCHEPGSSFAAQARPISQWKSVTDPVALVGAMWNHSPAMFGQLTKKALPWPDLTAQDLTDLLVYLRNSSPAMRASVATLQITESDAGAKLFESKGCINCHISNQFSSTLNLTGVAAAMWNHASLMVREPLHREQPHLDTAEMRDLLSYYWARSFFEGTGDAGHGKRVFTVKGCAGCHSAAGPGPLLTDKAGSWNGITIVSALWHHGPTMLEEMKAKKVEWPRFRAGEMTDLIAFINQKPTTKP